jgi:uncharacterized protein (DUF1778 family)
MLGLHFKMIERPREFGFGGMAFLELQPELPNGLTFGIGQHLGDPFHGCLLACGLLGLSVTTLEERDVADFGFAKVVNREHGQDASQIHRLFQPFVRENGQENEKPGVFGDTFLAPVREPRVTQLEFQAFGQRQEVQHLGGSQAIVIHGFLLRPHSGLALVVGHLSGTNLSAAREAESCAISSMITSFIMMEILGETDESVRIEYVQHLTASLILGTLLIRTLGWEAFMPRIAVDDNKRMNLRVRPDQKAALVRAAALKNTDLTDFVLQPALREAEAIIEAADHLKLSERDSLRVLEVLENPPRANARLRAAAMAMPSSA